jgi:hypothetical protein
LFLKANGTRYGPYFSPNHYEAIIPPLEFLNESHSSSLASHLQERELYIQVDNKEGNSNYTITIMQ